MTTDNPYGPRYGGAGEKGYGYFGPLTNSAGDVVTEYGIGVEINGVETEIPSIVPTLTSSQLQAVLDASASDSPPPNDVIQAATDFAEQRIAQGLSPFASPDEQRAPPKPADLLLNIDLSSNVTEPPSWFDDVSKMADRWIHQRSPWTGARWADGCCADQHRVIRSGKDVIRQFAMVKVPKKPEEDRKRPDVLNPNTALILQSARIVSSPKPRPAASKPGEAAGPEKISQGLVLIPQAALLAKKTNAIWIPALASVGHCDAARFGFMSSGCGNPPIDCTTLAPPAPITNGGPPGYGGDDFSYQTVTATPAQDSFNGIIANATAALGLPARKVQDPDGPLGGGAISTVDGGNSFYLSQGTDGPQGTSVQFDPMTFKLGTNPDPFRNSYVDTSNFRTGPPDPLAYSGYFPLEADCQALVLICCYGGVTITPDGWSVVASDSFGSCGATLLQGVIPAGATEITINSGVERSAGAMFCFPRIPNLKIAGLIPSIGNKEFLITSDMETEYDLANPLLVVMKSPNGDTAAAIGGGTSGYSPLFHGDPGFFINSQGGSGLETSSGSLDELTFSFNSNWNGTVYNTIPWYTTVVDDFTNISLFLESSAAGADLSTVQAYYSMDGGGLTTIPMRFIPADEFGVTQAVAGDQGSIGIGKLGPGVTFSFWVTVTSGDFSAQAGLSQGHNPDIPCGSMNTDYVGWMVGINP